MYVVYNLYFYAHFVNKYYVNKHYNFQVNAGILPGFNIRTITSLTETFYNRKWIREKDPKQTMR